MPSPLAEPPADEDPAAITPPESQTFRELGVAEPICESLEGVGIRSPFAIQALAVPVGLSGHDIIGQARTGTGKTLAFGIPLLQQVADAPASRPSAPAALVVVPTRELAGQVAEDLRVAGRVQGARVVTVYGGRAYEPQIDALRATVDIVVGTPGRLLDLAGQGHLDLSAVRSMVLDEADKMLDLGFLPDVERILELTPAERQTMLFSATMPGDVVTLARRHLNRPLHVRAEHGDEPDLVPLTVQHVFRAHQMDKIEMLARILQANGRGLSMVFCRTKRSADQVAEALATRGFAAAAVHGDLGQGQRERAMRAFRNGKIDVLVATDVAARGLDVDDVTHVINYECPEDDKAYLHRTGRTGRAGRDGIAVTFVDWRDMQRWKLINEALGMGQPEPPETYSTSEHLYSMLDIPAGVTGTLPRSRRGRQGLEAEELEDIGETGRSRSPAPRRPERGQSERGSQYERGGQAARKSRVRKRTRAGVTVRGTGDETEPAAPRGNGSRGGSAPQETARDGAAAPAQPRRRRRAGVPGAPRARAQPASGSRAVPRIRQPRVGRSPGNRG